MTEKAREKYSNAINFAKGGSLISQRYNKVNILKRSNISDPVNVLRALEEQIREQKKNSAMKG